MPVLRQDNTNFGDYFVYLQLFKIKAIQIATG